MSIRSREFRWLGVGAVLLVLASCQTIGAQTTEAIYQNFVPQNDPRHNNLSPANQKDILSAFDQANKNCEKDGKRAVILDMKAFNRRVYDDLKSHVTITSGGLLFAHICRAFDAGDKRSPYWRYLPDSDW
jgi:hypothetical protein